MTADHSTSSTSPNGQGRLSSEEYLAIPYRLRAYAHETPEGEWKRAAEYPEIGCVAYADTLLEALDLLEEQRRTFILERVDRPHEIPVPRAPLRWVVDNLRRTGIS